MANIPSTIPPPIISTSCRRGHLADLLATLLEIIDLLENDLRFLNLSPMGEPQLGRRGLVPSLGGKAAKNDQLALLWVLNLSDGSNSVLDIAERSGLPFDAIRRAIDALIGLRPARTRRHLAQVGGRARGPHRLAPRMPRPYGGRAPSR